MKNHGFRSWFFLIQKLIVETSFCALLVPILDQGPSELLQPSKKHTPPVHPQIPEISCVDFHWFSMCLVYLMIVYDCECPETTLEISQKTSKSKPFILHSGYPHIISYHRREIHLWYFMVIILGYHWWSVGGLWGVFKVWQVTAGPFDAASGPWAPEWPWAGGVIGGASWGGRPHITPL